MSAPDAERFVRYTLTAMIDPAARKTVKDFAAEFEKAQKGMTAAAKMEEKKREEDSAKSAEKRLKNEEKAAKEQQKIADRQAKDAQRVAEKKARDEAKAIAVQQKAQEKAAKEQAKLDAQKVKDAERAAEAKARADQRAAALAEREAQRIARINYRANEYAKKQAADLARAREQAEQKIRREYELTARLSQEYSRRMTDGFLKAGEGVATLGRGFVALGIASEDDLEKVVRTLARVQGIVDLAKGGIETYRGMRDAVDAYRKMVDAAAKSELILATIRGVTSRGTPMPKGAGWGAGGLGAFGVGGSGTALGTIGVAGAGVAAGVGVIGAGAALTNAGGFNDWFLRGGSTDENGQRISTFAGMNVDPNSGLGGFLGALAYGREQVGFNFDGVNLAAAQRHALASEKRARSMKTEQDTRYWMENNARMRLQAEFEAEQQRRESLNARDDLLGQLGEANPDAVMNRAQSALAYAQRQQAELQRMRAGTVEGQAQQFTAGQVDVQEQRTSAALSEALRLRQESLKIAQQTNREEKQAAEETIRKLDTQIEKQRRLQKESEDRLLSARERFGQLSVAEQKQAIAIKQKADANGYAALTREERAILRGIGTEGATQIASQGDVAAAQAAGFDQYFGGTERKKIQDAIAEQAKLEAEIKVNREVIVKLESDDERLINTVVDQVTTLLNEREAINEERMKRALIEQQAEQNKTLKNNQPPVM